MSNTNPANFSFFSLFNLCASVRRLMLVKAFYKPVTLLWCFIFLLLFHLSCELLAQSPVDMPDRWCENRISKDNSGSSTLFEVVDNPLKETGTNTSDKALKLSAIDQRGTIALNLTRYIGNATDRIPDISGYDGLRFKYYIKNQPHTSYSMRIRMEEGQGSIINGALSNKDKNWKTATFRFPKASETSWIQISTYYVTVGQWNDTFPAMEIYLDDVEFFDSNYISSGDDNNHITQINIVQSGKNLIISGIESDCGVTIYDVYGRNMVKSDSLKKDMQYTFPVAGIYFVALLYNNTELITRKVIVN